MYLKYFNNFKESIIEINSIPNMICNICSGFPSDNPQPSDGDGHGGDCGRSGGGDRCGADGRGGGGRGDVRNGGDARGGDGDRGGGDDGRSDRDDSQR